MARIQPLARPFFSLTWLVVSTFAISIWPMLPSINSAEARSRTLYGCRTPNPTTTSAGPGVRWGKSPPKGGVLIGQPGTHKGCDYERLRTYGKPAAGRNGASTRLTLFQHASRLSGVPLPLLIGLAWEQSFISDHGGRPSIDDGFGLLDLSARADHDTLDTAARMVHRSPDLLKHDDAFNLLGGALLLARYERSLAGRLPESIGDWTGAVVRFTGMRSAFTARLVTGDLFRALRHGIHAGGVVQRPIIVWPRLETLRGIHLESVVRSSAAEYPGATWVPASSANYTHANRLPSNHKIHFIVIHDTEGTCSTTLNWFQNPSSRASAHYVVCLDGTIYQMVRNEDIAWHAGNWPINVQAIGIEHEGYADHAYYTRAQYLASAALVRYLCHEYGLSENRNVIFGHENVPYATHTDPGPYWNWSFYMQRVRHDATGYSGGITDVAMVDAETNIYSCPRTSCAILGSANWGEQFAVTGQRQAWEQVSYTGKTGWIPSGFVTAGSGYVLRTTSASILRAGPKVTDAALATVPAGQSYVSLVRDGAYWYIEFNHRYGFLPAAAVQPTNCTGGHILGCLAPSGSSLSVTPNAAPPNIPVAVAGTGMPPNSGVAISVGGEPAGSAVSDAAGDFNTTVTIPADLKPSNTTIVATNSSGKTAQTAFQVNRAPSFKPVVITTPAEPNPGTKVTVSGKGLPPEQAILVMATFSLPSGVVKVKSIHTFSEPNGTLSPVGFTVPSKALPGTYALSAVAPGITAAGLLAVAGELPATATPTPGTPTPTPVEGTIVPPSPTATPTPIP